MDKGVIMNGFKDFLESSGTHFEGLFSKLMKSKYGSRYVEISTNGRDGDFKVDGILENTTAFAVYAPESYNDKAAQTKLKSDFNGFIMHKNNGNWSQISKYIFVVKRERSGVTPKIMNLISEFNKFFPVEIWTLQDIESMILGHKIFSNDGILFENFKNEVYEILEYIINTDFASQPFRITLADEIQESILDKWCKPRFAFETLKIDQLKNDILNALHELCGYLTIEYMHLVSNDMILFNNSSHEEGEKLRNDLQPNSLRIRKRIGELYNELYSIK